MTSTGPAAESVESGSTAPASAEAALAEVEHWFVRHGVPHFVEDRYTVASLPAFLRPFAALIRLARLGAMLGYWTVRRVFAEVREVGHLAVRALPLLALFGMVIFFSGDFWRIAAALTTGWLWVTAAFFVVLIQAFLVARLPEETGTLPRACTPDRIRASCAATPLAPLAEAEPDLATDPALGLGQRRNMFMYLLLTQTIQISLLSWMVFFFYVVFGAIAIRPPVLKDWFGHVPPDAHLWGVRVPGVSSELLHVAVLLAGLSALYFAITALTDAVYRREFFDRTLAELDKAIHMRCAYLTLRGRNGG
ncbi:hypothetical protein ABIA35_008433 [Catenulispora sp. MAP12-49]|uniref:hypothetical protein n=1 Tax=Catenulispora sp. MAP12-49 TaxID=3156302 RepID=UPI003513CE84